MTDKKKPFDLDNGTLKKLGGISMDELRERMPAMARPSALADLQDRLDQLARPPFPPSFQAQMDKLNSFQDQMERLARPSYLADFNARMDAMTKFQQQMEALARPHYLADIQARMEDVTRSSHLAEFQARMEEVTRSSHLAEFQARMEEVTRSSHLADIQARMEEMTRSSHLASIQARMAELTQPSYLEEFHSQLSSLSGGTRIQAELAVVAGSYQGLLSESVLASYLASATYTQESDTKAQRVARFDSLDVGDFAELEVDTIRSVDLQIVQAISEGKVAKLPPTAMQRLHSVYVQVLVYWDMLLRIFNTYMAYAFLTTLMSGASAPADVHERAAQLNNEQRVLLADVRMVNREGANLRAEPTTQSKSIASLPFAHPVEVLGYNDKGWYRVEAETPDGYLEGWMYVSVTTPVPKPKRLRGQKVDAETL